MIGWNKCKPRLPREHRHVDYPCTEDNVAWSGFEIYFDATGFRLSHTCPTCLMVVTMDTIRILT